MARKKPTVRHTLGNVFVNKNKQENRSNSVNHVSDVPTGTSCLVQNSLDDFLATAELAQRDFDSLHPRLNVMEPQKVVRSKAYGNVREDLVGTVVPIPRKPAWTKEMTPEELHQAENDAFVEWRQDLAMLEEELDATLTPYERNVDFWRQLWRVVERSDVVVQILDARDPLFFRSTDLEEYVRSLGKQTLIVMNKADFLTAGERSQWGKYFSDLGVPTVFFSALAEQERQGLLEPDVELGAHGNLDRAPDVLDCAALFARLESALPDTERPTIGMVGYPNVGKSSLINALLGVKKVSVSRQPGRTKHFQTIEVPERNLTLCDCPGLVFPSVVATKGHLLIRGVQPIDQSIDHQSPCELIVEKLGVERLLQRYNCASFAAPYRNETPGRCALSAFAESRGHLLKLKQPDVNWAATKVLKDYTTGALLWVEVPPGQERLVADTAPKVDAAAAAEAATAAFENMEDLGDFIEANDPDIVAAADERLEDKMGSMSRRKLRQLHKGMMRGKLQVRADGTIDPFTNHGSARDKKHRTKSARSKAATEGAGGGPIGSVELGFQAYHRMGRHV